eukprot:TRINITY_DN82367_c0_g1_i1.p1 TRINITY_DN82367_c0_g1~~TRINITY_DN82367_c0_g1_i1.p1  ORF type:complete len:419 (-),score=70.45 TRINITY_DN82367_c0_g1_i1:99-1355(-)
MVSTTLLQRLPAAKLLGMLEKREAGTVGVESNVYGSAMALPQIARSLEWPVMMRGLVVRAYFFLFFNVFIQIMLLYYVVKEFDVVDRFGGMMSLCNFGANMVNCPDGPGCTGPGGSQYTPSRLYSWDAIVSRTFTRDALIAVFPDRENEIKENLDVGEYGLESLTCRILCVFLFMNSMMSEFWVIYDMIQMLIKVPTRDESWVKYEVPVWASKAQVKDVLGCSELDFVNIQVSGMPFVWKVVNAVFVVFPKVILWKFACEVGTFFLMETAAMDDLIVNSVALNFILSIDELFFQTLTIDAVRWLLAHCDGFRLYDLHEEEMATDAQTLEKFAGQVKHGFFGLQNLLGYLPMRLIICIAWTLFFLFTYYHKECQRDEDGAWLSKPMYLPKSFDLGFLPAFFPRFFAMETEDTPYWKAEV